MIKMMLPGELNIYLNSLCDKEFKRLKRNIDAIYAGYSSNVRKEIISIVSDFNGKYDANNPMHEMMLENLNTNIDNLTDRLFEDVNAEFDNSMKRLYKAVYSGTSSTIKYKKEISDMVFNAMMSQDINKNWSGITYKNRLINHRDRLKFTLKGNLNSSIIKRDKMNANYKSAYKAIETQLKSMDRLCKTELHVCRIHSQLSCYKMNGYVKIKVILDDRCCDHCRKQADKIIPVNKAQPGRNVPSFHCGCRCSIIQIDREEVE